MNDELEQILDNYTGVIGNTDSPITNLQMNKKHLAKAILSWHKSKQLELYDKVDDVLVNVPAANYASVQVLGRASNDFVNGYQTALIEILHRVDKLKQSIEGDKE